VLHSLIAPQIGIPLLHRHYYTRTVIVLLLIGTVWSLWRLVDEFTERARERQRASHPGTPQTVHRLGRQILKGIIVAVALLVGLAAFGVDLTTTMAGLGLGGVALAFAAQRTLENLFGGIMVLSDRSVVVGDVCRIGTYLGEVEDVGLRSLQLRTLDRSLVYVPNGLLATREVENLSRRDRFHFRPTIRLRYETTLEQLQQVLSELRAMLAADPAIVAASQRVRFVKVGEYSLDVEVVAYILAANDAAFLEQQERLLLRIMGIVTSAGTGFAFPSQTMYVQQDRYSADGMATRFGDASGPPVE
jgi:MscS family membrane protein